ncbi:non-ribosomal peptide synthetase [Microbulbifer taiwanensis]|uniref:Non-ribosomal peptide synthetase n=2 Tax=Microbulbifer taiwanensis TaxID=986746 RepID=A0ABW1YHY7_9GAMM|nr:non-ribosomal peptide synthetase [Microbulbifer taiwanensis]
MPMVTFIKKMNTLGIKLWLEDGQLKFKAPKGTWTDEIRDELIANKEKLIAFLQQASGERQPPSIRPVKRGSFVDRVADDESSDQFPLSFAQERLWFIDQLDPDSATYNIPIAVSIRSEVDGDRARQTLDISQIEQAFNVIITRHENLRTIFPSSNGKAQQLVLENVSFMLECVDLRHVESEEARDQEFQRLCQIEARTPFDLSKGPLLRVKLCKLTSYEHVLILNIHHIISDGWSMGVMVKEFVSIIEAFRQGKQPQLPPLPIQYLDYSIWQRKWLSADHNASDLSYVQAGEENILQQQLTYWREKLDGVPESLNLATDFPRPAVQSSSGAKYLFSFDGQLTKQLKSIAEQEGCTLFMVLLTAFKILLYRYSNQEDICIGTPVANRHYEGTESLIGLFINTLVLRNKVDGSATFSSLLSSVKKTCLEAFEHQDVPFEKIVDLVQPHRNAAISPLFQVMFILQNTPRDALGKGVSAYPLDMPISKFDITLQFNETPEGLDGSIEFRTTLFKQQTIERLVENFRAISQIISTRPGANISEIEFIREEEKQKLLKDYNYTRADYPREKCIHELFMEQVAVHPDRTAVVYEDESLSYQQLYEKSHALAIYLQSLGVQPDSLVGLCLERSPSMMVGILGILQAGGAYVPLDPEYPDDRLTYMLEDSHVTTVLTQEKFKWKLISLVSQDTQLIALDAQWVEITDCSANLEDQQVKLQQAVKPDHLAYVIYTSGSTGKPKGVMVGHQALTNRIYWMQQQYPLSIKDTVLQKTPFTFDVSVWEFLWPMMSGTSVVFAKPGGHKDAQYLENLINQENITTLHFVPSMFHVYLSHAETNCSSVRRIFCSGESLDSQAVYDCRKKFPQALLYNLYGPTEAAIDVTAYNCALLESSVVPIGTPISNIQIYILDHYNNPTSLGVPGELHIAGDGLARGYLNRPELTAEKFIPNPFNPGSRMYKSGDLARWLDDGNIEYLGRIDAQVKIRGFRIELGEIEAQLNRFPAIKDSVVIAQGQEGNKQLIAYYVARDTDEGQVVDLAHEDLRAHLQQTLPDFMLPAAFVSLSAIPLSSNGKADRRALASMEVSLESSQAYLAPRNAAERKLVAIWAEVLDLEIEKIGISDNFFELGGDSIKTIQIVAKAIEQGIHFDTRDMFNYQSISELLQNCETSKSKEIIKEDGILVGDVALSPIQQHFFGHSHTDTHYYNQSVLLNLNTRLSEESLREIVDFLARHHDALRLRFTRNEQSWQQQYLGEDQISTDMLGIACFEVESRCDATVVEYVTEVCEQLQASLDLENGPLIRWAYFTSDEGDQLAIIIHHLIIDGVSWRIMLEDLNLLISQQQSNQTLKLAQKRSSYRNWVDSLALWYDTEEGQEDLAFWIAQSEKTKAAAEISVNPFLTSKSYCQRDIQNTNVRLSKATTKKLLKQCHQAYGTYINDLLLTAVILSYYQSTGSRSLIIDVEGHGREQIYPGVDITRTVGWFTSLYPVSLALSNPGDIGQSIKEVKYALHAIPNKGVGYPIFRYINQHPASGKMPEGQVLFNFLGDFQPKNTKASEQHFAFSESPTGANSSGNREVSKLVTINGMVVFDQLSFNFSYPQAWLGETISEWQNKFANMLEAIVEHCGDAPRLGYTPDDFPLLKASLEQLDEIMPVLEQQQQLALDNIQDMYPLTPLQSGILFETLFSQTEDNKGMYLTQVAIGINGQVDTKVLQHAWQLIVDHYDALRMRVVIDDVANSNTPLQVILRQVDVEITEVDWTDKKDSELKSACELWMQESKRSGIRLQQGPLMRMSLFTGHETSYLLFEQHHIMLDGWSQNIVLSNLFKLYQALIRGQGYHLPKSPAYGAYVQTLLNRNYEEETLYWSNYLSHYEQRTPLPMKHLSPQQSSLAETKERNFFETTCFSLSREDTVQLEKFIKKHRLTMNTVLQFIWGLLLHLHTGNKSVTFGSVSSGRSGILDINHSDQIVGLCINTTPTCIRFEAEHSLLAQLKQMQRRESEKLSYEVTPLSHIQELLGSIANDDLFQTLFVYENYPVQKISEANSLVKDFISNEAPSYPLSIVAVSRETLDISLTWDSYYYHKSTICSLAEQFERLTMQLLAAPNALIKDISLLTAQQKQKVIADFNATQAQYPEDKCIHDLFMEQVARYPDKTAVVFEDESISYQLLYDRSHALALYLQSLGVTPDATVGVSVDRSLEMIVGILAILLAGGAYVPLDPDYPQDRLTYMLADSQSAIVLTQEALIPKLTELVAKDTQLIALDKQWPEIEQRASDFQVAGVTLAQDVNSGHLAYVIYTSGSTGQPKGVMVCHKAVNRLVKNTNFMAVSSEDTFLQFASLSFDAATLEIWAPLLNGGKLVVAPPGKDAVNRLGELIGRHDVTVLWLTSGLFQLLVKENVTQLAGLRVLLSGGDVVPVETAREFLEHSRDSIFINGYGPTENTTFTSCYVVSDGLNEGISSLPIGSPIANTQVYILDRYQQPVPVGVPGELHIAGDGLARGYLNQPTLTAEKFIANPFTPGSKLYRSGDLARWQEDGTIEYLGRIDSQVKIRGFRIEIGEIESQLKRHPDVRDCVIVAQGPEAERQLLACYVAKDSKEGEVVKLSNAQLTEHLRRNLPEHMIPALYLSLAAIPLTPNGKVDQLKLAAMEVSAESDADYVAPRNETERQLVAIWSEVLKLDPENVGVNDNFFELGGQSLSAIQVVSKVQSQLGIKVSLKALFSANTIVRVSEVCQAIKAQHEKLSLKAELTEGEFEEFSL